MREVLDKTTVKFAVANGGDIVHGHVAALKKLWSLTYREAQVQSFADAFLVIAVCCAIATLAVPFLRKISSPATPSSNVH
jgi:DHA2 family multidrug resistance protein